MGWLWILKTNCCRLIVSHQPSACLLYIHQASLWSSSLPPACTSLLPIQEENPAFIPRVFSTHLHLCGGSPACSLLSVQIPPLRPLQTRTGSQPWYDLTPTMDLSYLTPGALLSSCTSSRSAALSDLLCIFSSTLSNVMPVALLCCSLIVPGFKNVSLYVPGLADQLHPPKTFHFLCLFGLIWFVGMHTNM